MSKYDIKHLDRILQIGITLKALSDRVSSCFIEQTNADNNSIKKIFKAVENLEVFIEEEVTRAVQEVAEQFLEAAAKKYLDMYYRTIYRAQVYRNKESGTPFKTPGFPPIDEYLKIVEKQVEIYKELKSKMVEIVKNRTFEGMSRQEIQDMVDKACQQEYAAMQDVIQEYEIQGALRALKSEYIMYYQFVCFDVHTACSECAGLNGKYFKVTEAQAGVNLPPLHPNCKCTIGSYLGDITDESDYANWYDDLKQWAESNLSGFYANWKLTTSAVEAYKELLLSYLGESVPIEIGGKTYAYDQDNLQNIVVANGELVNPENATDIDLRLLELMRQRDGMRERGAAYADIIEEAYALMAKNQGNFSVDFFKPYSYYELGRDVTQELKDLLDDYAELYKDQIDSSSYDLELFRSLVANRMELDLKNRPGFQNSAFIFDGEIVDQDALGNIVYGYLGKLFGIPDNLLFVGAGYAQGQAGTGSEDFSDTQGDDPRDQYRILQGIWWYENERENQTKAAS